MYVSQSFRLQIATVGDLPIRPHFGKSTENPSCPLPHLLGDRMTKKVPAGLDGIVQSHGDSLQWFMTAILRERFPPQYRICQASMPQAHAKSGGSAPRSWAFPWNRRYVSYRRGPPDIPGPHLMHSNHSGKDSRSLLGRILRMALEPWSFIVNSVRNGVSHYALTRNLSSCFACGLHSLRFRSKK